MTFMFNMDGIEKEHFESFEIEDFLGRVVKHGISDVHLKIGTPPMIRRHGYMIKTDAPELTHEDMNTVLKRIVPERFYPKINDVLDFDFSVEISGARFRVNLCRELGNIGLVLRVISYDIPSLATLNLPPVIENFTRLNTGIVIVTGPTGSGKSTTIASILDNINQNQQKHIITLEDPVEFLHRNKKSIFTQRQLGVDTDSFPNGVKYALRQDPDIIVIGEMRDRETILSALKAAETGHLVFSTLHTIDAVQTINRVINAFEPYEKEALRLQLANTLRGTISQKLLNKKDESGRVPCVEILSITPAARNYIIKDQIDSIYELIRTGSFNDMVSMNLSILKLVKANVVSKEEALRASDIPNELEQMIRGAFHGTKDISQNMGFI